MLTSRTSRRFLLTLLGAAFAAATAAPGASALVQRHAGPTGSGTACTADIPCTITQAVTGASAADEVIVNPGDGLVSTRLTLAGRFITVRLSCPAATAGRCSGRTKLSARRAPSGSRTAAPVILGRASFSIAAGQRARTRVRVTRAGRRLLAGATRLRGRAASVAQSGAGESKTTVTAVTIRRAQRTGG